MNRSSSRQGPTASLTTAQRTQSCCCVCILHAGGTTSTSNLVPPRRVLFFVTFRETLLCRVSFALFTHVVASLIKMHTFTYVRYAHISTSPSTVSERGARETNLCSCGVEARDLTLCHL